MNRPIPREIPTMFDRISNSFSLARSSWDVLRRDKKFVVFPIVSSLGCLLVLISFAIPMAVVALKGGIAMHDHNQPPWWTYVVAFAFYFCNYFVIVFCNAALISCALMRFAGEEPTLADGFGAAAARLPQILAWSLVSATVGVLLKVIENAHEKAGQIISMLLGTAWTVITFFVVPVLVVEKVGPLEAVRRSVELLKRTWGEALVGHWGIGFFAFLLTLPGILALVLGFFLLSQSVVAGAAILAVAILYLLACGAITSALNTIFLAALYQYASVKTVPVGFDREVIEGAFMTKRSR
jgi:Family of unknown function (DUF6159)